MSSIETSGAFAIIISDLRLQLYFPLGCLNFIIELLNKKVLLSKMTYTVDITVSGMLLC